MIICTDIRPLDQNAINFRRKALRDAVVCMGWIKITSVICYVVLYFLVYSHSTGEISEAIKIMILISIPLQIIHGVLLFYGALRERILALNIGLWLCLLLAWYNTVLGVTGGLYFIKTGHQTVHFLLAVAFTFLAISLFTILCHDVILICTLKREMTVQMRNDVNSDTT